MIKYSSLNLYVFKVYLKLNEVCGEDTKPNYSDLEYTHSHVYAYIHTFPSVFPTLAKIRLKFFGFTRIAP